MSQREPHLTLIPWWYLVIMQYVLACDVQSCIYTFLGPPTLQGAMQMCASSQRWTSTWKSWWTMSLRSPGPWEMDLYDFFRCEQIRLCHVSIPPFCWFSLSPGGRKNGFGRCCRVANGIGLPPCQIWGSKSGRWISQMPDVNLQSLWTPIIHGSWNLKSNMLGGILWHLHLPGMTCCKRSWLEAHGIPCVHLSMAMDNPAFMDVFPHENHWKPYHFPFMSYPLKPLNYRVCPIATLERSRMVPGHFFGRSWNDRSTRWSSLPKDWGPGAVSWAGQHRCSFHHSETSLYNMLFEKNGELTTCCISFLRLGVAEALFPFDSEAFCATSLLCRCLSYIPHASVDLRIAANSIDKGTYEVLDILVFWFHDTSIAEKI